MNKSESITTLAGALAEAQKKIGPAPKDAENPFFKSHYADLGSVMSVCKEPLLEQGITVLQMVGADGNGGYLETILLHKSGEFISDRMKLVCAKQHDPQAMGSAISYARRYALQSALFIPAVDDDGENAMKPTREIDANNRAAEERQERREERDRQNAGYREPERIESFEDVRRVMNGNGDDWRNAVCTYGKKDGPLRGKHLGELSDRNLKFLCDMFLREGVTVQQKDAAMVRALRTWQDKGSAAAAKMRQDVENRPQPPPRDDPDDYIPSVGDPAEKEALPF